MVASCGRSTRLCVFTSSPRRSWPFWVVVIHKELAPAFDPLLRAAAITIIVVLLDALLVAPFFERSYAMFRSVIGTWLPFVAIFGACWAAGVLAPG